MIQALIRRVRAVDNAIFGRFADHYHGLLARHIARECQTLLDVGCGSSSPIRFFANLLQHTVGVDAFAPALEASRLAGIHSEYRLLDVTKIGTAFAPCSFDCVLASDLIEHLPKQAGMDLLGSMEKIARVKVVVFTPNGFLEQRPYDGNEGQIHRSGWTVSEMEGLGYRVIGVNGWKPLRTERANIAWWPKSIWLRISYLTQPFTERNPKHAFQLLCVKSMKP